MSLGTHVYNSLNFVLGTVMTFVSGAAILLSLWVWIGSRTSVVNA